MLSVGLVFNWVSWEHQTLRITLANHKESNTGNPTTEPIKTRRKYTYIAGTKPRKTLANESRLTSFVLTSDCMTKLREFFYAARQTGYFTTILRRNCFSESFVSHFIVWFLNERDVLNEWLDDCKIGKHCMHVAAFIKFLRTPLPYLSPFLDFITFT